MWLLVSLAAASTLPDLGEPVRTGAAAPADSAVVIGIDAYPFLKRDAQGAAEDALSVKDVLVYTVGVPPDRIQHLGQAAAREAILDAAREAGAATGPDGTVWLYFAGLGASAPATGEPLWLGIDTQPTESSLTARGVPVAEVEALAGASGARVVSIADTSYLGVDRSGAPLLDARLAVPGYALAPKAALAWQSAGEGGHAQRLEGLPRGAFTYFAVGALRGWADGELDGQRDGSVRFDEARAYVDRMLREHAKGQRPRATGADTAVLSRGPEGGPGSAVATEAPVAAAAPAAAAAPPPSFDYDAVVVEPGTFTFKSINSQKVRLTRPFRIGVTEVTQGLYEHLLGENPVQTRRQSWRTNYSDWAEPEEFGPCRLAGVGPALPVTCVDTWDIARFANALSERDGLDPAYAVAGDPAGGVSAIAGANGWRLPTMYEWWWAALQGGPMKSLPGADRDTPACDAANLADTSVSAAQRDLLFSGEPFPCDDGAPTLAPVGSYPARAGLLDLAGNAAERAAWAEARWEGLVVDPPGDTATVAMGGSFLHCPYMEMLYAGSVEDRDRKLELGFRLVRSAD